MRGALVVAEVALSVVLLVGASLMIRTLLSIQGANLAFHPDRILTLRIPFSEQRYPDAEPPQRVPAGRAAADADALRACSPSGSTRAAAGLQLEFPGGSGGQPAAGHPAGAWCSRPTRTIRG